MSRNGKAPQDEPAPREPSVGELVAELRALREDLARSAAEVEGLRRQLAEREGPPDPRPAEAALRESERRLRSIATATPTFLMEIDEQGRIRYLNRVYQGMTERLILGTALRDWVPPESRPLVDQVVAAAFATGKPQAIEYQYTTPDGVEHVYMAQLGAYPDSSAATPAALLTLTDISEWKRTSAALGDSEQQLRSLFENAPIGLFHVSRAGRVLRANPSLAAMLGYPSVDELAAAIGDRGVAFLVDPELSFRSLAPVMTSTQWVHHDARLYRRDGSVMDARLMVRKVVAPDGELAYIEGFLEDLTERRRAEQERDRLFNRSVDLFCVSGLDGMLKQWNPAVERALGWSREELASEPFLRFIHPEDVDRLLSKLTTATLPTTTTNDEYRVRCKDGSHRWISFSSYAEPGGTSIFSVGRDVTERRLADEARARLETELLHSQKMEGIGRLAGGIAHDFNNILGVILSYASFAINSVDHQSPMLRDLREIEVAAERGADLTRQLLAFSRKSIVSPTLLDLNASLTALERMIERIVGEDVAFAVRCHQGLWPVRLDASSFDQVVLNLVVNARDAMPTGGRLQIETANASAADVAGWPEVIPGDHVRVSVVDSGSGMAPEVLAHLFEPFFTTKPEGQGTGLGLATVYGIVKQAGGHVLVSSEPGRGSRFDLLFPRVVAEASAGPVPPRASHLPARPATILVVDDEHALRRIVVRTLQSRGYQVLEAAGGGPAIECAAQHQGPIDLVVSDVIMPGMNGREMVEILMRARPGLRVLYMSGYTDDVIARHGIRESEVHFLPKPFTPAALLAAVATLVE